MILIGAHLHSPPAILGENGDTFGLIDAVRAPSVGGCVTERGIMRDLPGNRATSDTAAGRLTSSNRASQQLSKLTPRERQVLGLMAQGKTNKEIAALLVTSEGTAKTHVAHIFRKLEVSDRIGAVLAALGIDPSKLLPAA